MSSHSKKVVYLDPELSLRLVAPLIELSSGSCEGEAATGKVLSIEDGVVYCLFGGEEIVGPLCLASEKESKQNGPLVLGPPGSLFPQGFPGIP